MCPCGFKNSPFSRNFPDSSYSEKFTEHISKTGQKESVFQRVYVIFQKRITKVYVQKK